MKYTNINRKQVHKIVLICLLFCCLGVDILCYLQDVDAKELPTNFSTEEHKRASLREKAKKAGLGTEYTYNVYEQQKELIFKQLEIVTGDEDTRYIIVPGDTITVSYMDRKKKVGAVYKVSGDGKIFLPLVGPVKIAGLNRQQARKMLNVMFSEYIRHPDVQISVNTSGRFMVLGAVGKPGVYLLRPSLTTMEAILYAGSYIEDDANLRSVLVMRGSVDKPEVKRLDLWKLVKKGDRSDDIFVKPGDIIYVPTKFIANVEKFTNRIYRYVSAYYNLGRLPAPPLKKDNQIIFYEK